MHAYIMYLLTSSFLLSVLFCLVNLLPCFWVHPENDPKGSIMEHLMLYMYLFIFHPLVRNPTFLAVVGGGRGGRYSEGGTQV